MDYSTRHVYFSLEVISTSTTLVGIQDENTGNPSSMCWWKSKIVDLHECEESAAGPSSSRTQQSWMFVNDLIPKLDEEGSSKEEQYMLLDTQTQECILVAVNSRGK